MAKIKSSTKKTGARKFASIGLWVSGIAFIATIILAIVKLISIAKIYTIPNLTIFNWAWWISGALVILGLAAYTLLDPKRVREIVTGRQARYGSNALIMLLAFLGVLLVVNIVVFQNPGKPIDLTEDKSNSLAPETLAALKSLPADVHATAFFSSSTDPTTAQKLLTNYKNNSSGKFTYEFVDPTQNPLLAQQAGITGDGMIYIQMGSEHEIVSLASEQELTSGLIRLMNPAKQTIYFLTGHGERDISNSSSSAYTVAKAALEAKNYTVKSLNLIADNKIPSDATAIVIAGPTKPITSTEATLLEDYMTNGGSLIVMQEPTPLTQFGNSPDPLADYLASEWGITFDNDIVIDTNTTQYLYAVAAAYANHPITEKLQNLVSFFPDARSLTLSTNVSNAPTGLVTTNSSTWGETDFAAIQNNGQVSYKAGSDFPGPLTLAAVAQNTSTGSHLVVFGDADFASDQFFNQYANGNLFLNSIDWAVGQEQLINLTSPKTITRTLNLPTSFGLLVMALSFLILLPGLVIAGGIVSWLIRRSRG